jgi:hypothetical protein
MASALGVQIFLRLFCARSDFIDDVGGEDRWGLVQRSSLGESESRKAEYVNTLSTQFSTCRSALNSDTPWSSEYEAIM